MEIVLFAGIHLRDARVVGGGGHNDTGKNWNKDRCVQVKMNKYILKFIF